MRGSRGPKVCAPGLRPSSKAPAGFNERRLPRDLLSIVTCRSTNGGPLLLSEESVGLGLGDKETSSAIKCGCAWDDLRLRLFAPDPE
ncbi:hypothetical protein MTO96_010795 [Rhipicephalus appendiculatus]